MKDKDEQIWWGGMTREQLAESLDSSLKEFERIQSLKYWAVNELLDTLFRFGITDAKSRAEIKSHFWSYLNPY